MQVVKKRIKLIISVMGIVLLCACTKRVPVSVIPAHTPTSVPTEQAIHPSVTEKVEVSPTSLPSLPTEEPTETPTSVPTKTSTPKPSPTEKREPTKTPTPTPTKKPTKTPIPTPTKTPTATQSLSPTKTPTVTQEITPTKIPVPTITASVEIDLEMLVMNGWQSLLDIGQSYYVIFSDCFNDSEVKKGEQTLDIQYTSAKEEKIRFQVLYSMQQTLEIALEKIVEQGGIVLEEDYPDRRVSYQLEEEQTIYQGVIVENEYKKELLGNVFGEEDSITGTMQIVFSYPKEMQAKYETEIFDYYVVRIP